MYDQIHKKISILLHLAERRALSEYKGEFEQVARIMAEVRMVMHDLSLDLKAVCAKSPGLTPQIFQDAMDVLGLSPENPLLQEETITIEFSL